MLLRRFADVDGPGLLYVQAAAILGVHYDHAIAAELAGVTPAIADEALVALTRAGVLADAGGGTVAFVHPLFAQAVLDAQPSARAQAPARRGVRADRRAATDPTRWPPSMPRSPGSPAIRSPCRSPRAPAAPRSPRERCARHPRISRTRSRWPASTPRSTSCSLRGQALVAQADVEPRASAVRGPDRARARRGARARRRCACSHGSSCWPAGRRSRRSCSPRPPRSPRTTRPWSRCSRMRC